jgi:hypothetical protein
MHKKSPENVVACLSNSQPGKSLSCIVVTYCHMSTVYGEEHEITTQHLTSNMAHSLTLAELLKCLNPYPNLIETLSLSTLFHFIRCAAVLRQDILLTQSIKHSPDIAPEFLPQSILYFFSEILQISIEDTKTCWTALKEIIWEGKLSYQLEVEPLHLFKEYGTGIGLSECYYYMNRMPSYIYYCTKHYMPFTHLMLLVWLLCVRNKGQSLHEQSLSRRSYHIWQSLHPAESPWAGLPRIGTFRVNRGQT